MRSGAQERQKLLSFVIVGGGPTGVEVAAELHDMIQARTAAAATHVVDPYPHCFWKPALIRKMSLITQSGHGSHHSSVMMSIQESGSP